LPLATPEAVKSKKQLAMKAIVLRVYSKGSRGRRKGVKREELLKAASGRYQRGNRTARA
jgi:hypothetical protein